MFIDNIPAAGGSGILIQVIMGMLTKGSKTWTTSHYTDLAYILGCRLNSVLSAGVPEKLEVRNSTCMNGNCLLFLAKRK